MMAPSLAIVGALALWELVVGIGLLNEDHVPSMTATVSELAELFGDPDFWSALGSTLQGWALGLGIAAVLAIPLGILIGSSPPPTAPCASWSSSCGRSRRSRSCRWPC